MWTRGAQGTIYQWTHARKGALEGSHLGMPRIARGLYSQPYSPFGKSNAASGCQSTVITCCTVARYFQLNSFSLLLSATESHTIANSPRANKRTANNIHLVCTPRNNRNVKSATVTNEFARCLITVPLVSNIYRITFVRYWIEVKPPGAGKKDVRIADRWE